MSENSACSPLALLVIRSDDMERAAAFYSALGLELKRHSHPPCGEHYSTTQKGCVFEICRRHPKQKPTSATFFGIHVANVDASVKAVLEHGGKLERPAAESEWGRNAIISDIDAHRVMLIQRDD